MQTSLYAGISGLNANMEKLSVIGNNIANVNTVGFKSSRVTFGDVLSQTLSGGSGTNQVGLGVEMTSIQKQFSQGAFETTSSSLDLAISGNGFFMVKDTTLNATYYTRAGQFQADKDGYIVNPEGLVLQGYLANSSGTLQNTVTNLQLSTTTIAPNATTGVDIKANLDSNSPITGYVFDSTSDDIVFNAAGGVPAGPYTASLITDGGLSSGTAYDGGSVAAALKAALEAKNNCNDTYTVTYDDQTGKFTVTNDTGNSNLTLSWADAGTTADTLLGFTASSGAIVAGSSDTSDNAGGDFLLANAGDTSNFSTPVTVYDTLGNEHVLTMYFRKSASSATGNQWEWFAVVDADDSPTGQIDQQANGTATFDTSGALSVQTTSTNSFSFTGGSTSPQTIDFSFGTSIAQGGTGTDGTTQYSTSSGVSMLTQDGYSAGTLQRISIDKDGIIRGIYSNGRDLSIGQVLLADFAAPGGLTSAGNNLYSETYDSGQPLVGSANSAGRGLIQSSTLELSNVDIANEFVNMITAQRGFQANSKIITTTDELLAELVNIKR